MVNLGRHLASRLVEVGVGHCFGVPGDFNLLLLDQLLTHPDLNMVWCCNELNAGYAADGYARSKGVGACVVTFTVGGLSVINAIAGAYSEDLPVIVISGGPNTNDYATNRVLHHTTGLPDFDQQYRCFAEVTCAQVKILHVEDAQAQIDQAITQAILHSKPVYIEVACNLPDLTHPSFTHVPVRYQLPVRHTNPLSLKAAVEATVEVLKGAVKPVILAGPRLRSEHRREAFTKLADASKYAVAVLPDAKGLFPESHEGFVGTYWGAVSSPCCCETVEAADLVITAGAVWTDYTTVGYSLLLKRSKMIRVENDRVTILDAKTFGCINMQDFLEALAEVIPQNNSAVVNYRRMYVPLALPGVQAADEPLKTIVLMKHVQDILTPETALVSEVGDSWFNSQKLRLPDGCGYELQLRYGSIGWSVGAVLGYSLAARGKKRVLALIGDGSFQMTAQEVSTMMRYGANPVILLINNGGYTIEVEIHDGPYNNIKNWDYTALVQAFRNREGAAWTTTVKTEGQLVEALRTAQELTDSLCFIEVMVHRDDCSHELLEWGSRVSAANSRRPNPQ